MQDPRKKYPQPPFPKQKQPPPGLESKMDPLPDWGRDSYQGSDKLKNKVALITGGDSGIGRAVAWAFAKEGADIVISYLNEDEDAELIKKPITDIGRKAILAPGDIQDPKICQHLIDQTVQTFGRIDILVNNAAYQMGYNSLEEITFEEFDRAFKTNVYATFFLSSAAVKHMQPGASIINTTSIVNYEPLPLLIPYSATKAAIANMTKSLAQKFIKEYGVRVNAVAPGPIWTPLIPISFPEEKTSQHGTGTWIGRAGQPAELAPVYVFLASEEASYVVGHIVGATGGRGFP